jgi:hypothetical protein
MDRADTLRDLEEMTLAMLDAQETCCGPICLRKANCGISAWFTLQTKGGPVDVRDTEGPNIITIETPPR